MDGLQVVPGVETTALAYLARHTYEAPKDSPKELAVDGNNIIAKAEPVILAKEVTSSDAASLDTPAESTSITLSVNGEDKTASGKVSGLAAGQHADYKVVVYLKTDIWYIQPVANSSAAIDENGNWQMEELQIISGVPTTAYAYLVRQDYAAPNESPQKPQIDNVNILSEASSFKIQ